MVERSLHGYILGPVRGSLWTKILVVWNSVASLVVDHTTWLRRNLCRRYFRRIIRIPKSAVPYHRGSYLMIGREMRIRIATRPHSPSIKGFVRTPRELMIL